MPPLRREQCLVVQCPILVALRYGRRSAAVVGTTTSGRQVSTHCCRLGLRSRNGRFQAATVGRRLGNTGQGSMPSRRPVKETEVAELSVWVSRHGREFELKRQTNSVLGELSQAFIRHRHLSRLSCRRASGDIPHSARKIGEKQLSRFDCLDVPSVKWV